MVTLNEKIKKMQEDIENCNYVFSPRTGELRECNRSREPGFLWVTDIYYPVYDDEDNFIGSECGFLGFVTPDVFRHWI